MSQAMQLIVRSGQARKLVVGVALLAGGFLLLLLGAFMMKPLTVGKLVSLSIAASALCVAGFAYLCLAIRCRNCGARWIWLLASKRPGNPGHFDHHSDRCPLCGNRG